MITLKSPFKLPEDFDINKFLEEYCDEPKSDLDDAWDALQAFLGCDHLVIYGSTEAYLNHSHEWEAMGGRTLMVINREDGSYGYRVMEHGAIEIVGGEI